MVFLGSGREERQTLSQISSLDLEPVMRTIVLSDLLGGGVGGVLSGKGSEITGYGRGENQARS